MNTGFMVAELYESTETSDENLRENLEVNFSIHINELKGSLSTIINTSEAILKITDLTPEELHEYLGQIHSNAHKMDEIINRPLA